MTTVAQRAYLAGILDGEGSVMVRHLTQERGPRPFVAIAQSNLPFIQQIREEIGGGWIATRFKVPCLIDCTTVHLHARTPNWQLHFQGERAAIFLENVRPYLRIKGDLADNAISVWRDRISPKRGALDRVRRQMDGLGWDVGPLFTQHGEYRHYSSGCRCDECRAANARRSAIQRANLALPG